MMGDGRSRLSCLKQFVDDLGYSFREIPLGDPFAGSLWGIPLGDPFGRSLWEIQFGGIPLGVPFGGSPSGDPLGRSLWEVPWRDPFIEFQKARIGIDDGARKE